MTKLGRCAAAILTMLVLGLVFMSSPLGAQQGAVGTASLNGTVTDPSGATIAGAALKLVDTRTNNTYTAQSGKDGGYRFVDIPPGPAYALTVTKQGFEAYTLSGLYLPVSVATTKDTQLVIGQITQTVEVTADTGSVSLNTTDATIGNNLDMHAVESLPNEYRDNVANLLRIQAGVVDARVNNLSAGQSHMDPNNTRDGSVAGARADQNNITVDGIDATDVATGAPFGGNVGVAALPVDAIQEFNTQVAQPGAANGGRSGAQSMIVTKSGTNAWHGSAFEYNRTAATEANTFFNNQVGVPRLALVRNQWGANIGGPVLKNKLFFFFEYSGRHDASALSELQLVPYPHVSQGEIAYVNNNAGCTINSRLGAVDAPTNCISFAPATEVQTLDPCHTAGTCGTGPPCVLPGPCVGAPGFVAAGAAPVLLNAFAHRYPAPNDFALGDGINTAGLLFNAPNPLKDVLFVTRVDYNIDANNKLFGRFNMINYSAINLAGGLEPVQFPGDPLTALETVRDRAWVVGETWTINSTTINQFTVGETRQNFQAPIAFTPPAPASLYELAFFGSVAGQTFATPYERQSAQGRVVPDPTLRDDVTLIRGKHTIQFGGQWNPVKIRSNLINDFSLVQEGLGGSFSGLEAAFRPANIGTDPAILANWDNFFVGDLGILNNDQTAINYDGSGTALPPGSSATRDWRLYQIGVYVEDSWRIRQDLTITGGLRYQYQGAPYEVHGTEAQFSNTNVADIIATREANGLAGISGPDATPLLTYQLSGKGNHQGKPLYNPDKLDFSPRLALAWNPSFTAGVLGHLLGDRKSVVRAGTGLVYDQAVIYAITDFEDQSNYLFGNTVGEDFNAGNTAPDPILFALENDPRMNSLSAPPFGIARPAFTNPLTPSAIFNEGIDPKLHTPYSITASLGVQRELRGGFQLDSDYFGRFGRRLAQLADVGQAMDFTDRTSGMGNQTLVQAFSAIEQFSRANPVTVLPPNQNFLEDQVSAALGAPCAVAVGMSCTAYVYTNNYGALQQGGTGVVLASIPLPQNVGLTPQFFVNALMANKGFSDYNAAFVTLRKRLSNNLQFDFNYTFSHSIDNGSTVQNVSGSFAQGVTSVMCDVTNNRACRGNSEFDATHQISAEFVYDLPFGRGQKFGRNVGTLLNEAIGGWSVAGIQTWRTGLAFTVNNTNIATYDTVSLAADTGMLFTGSRSAIQPHPHFDTATGSEQLFANPITAGNQFSPVSGLESGTRDNLRGPRFSNLDLSVSKNFPLGSERYRLQFRAEAYNVLNHPNFGIPDTGVTSGQFGVISGLAGAEPSRVMQFALRFDF